MIDNGRLCLSHRHRSAARRRATQPAFWSIRVERETGEVLHDWRIQPREYERPETRRGRRHAFEVLDPRRTALVVVDMVPFFIEQNSYARGIVPTSIAS